MTNQQASINEDAVQVNEALQKDAKLAADLLIEYANKWSQRKEHGFKAVLLKSKLNRLISADDREELVDDIQALVRTIQENQSPVVQAPSVVNNDEIRGRYLEKGILKRVVFECSSVHKSYKDFKLQNVNLNLRLGEVTGIVGENANGKTTMLRILAGDLLPESGDLKYYFHGDTPDPMDWADLKRHIGYLPQTLEPLNGTVQNNLRIAASSYDIKGADNRLEVDYLLYRLNLEEHKHKLWKELSGGYQLRFALARILVRKPKLIVLDEPLANLDIIAQNILLNDLKDIANNINDPISIILSSQSIEEVESVSDKMIVLSRGKILFNGPTSSIGSLRTENWFEIRSPLPKEQFKALFADFDYLRFQYNGFAYLITTSMDKNINDVLKYILEHGIAVSNVSDISNTTKKTILELNIV